MQDTAGKAGHFKIVLLAAAGLEDRSRRDRPSAFSPRVVAEVKALACELHARLGPTVGSGAGLTDFRVQIL